MSNQFMPLSGAILVTNPRRSAPVGLALTNPNDRRRINAAARVHIKTGTSITKLVKMIADGKSAKAIKKAGGIYNAPRKGKKAALTAAIKAGKKMSEGEKADRRYAYAQAKQRIAAGMSKLPGYGPSSQMVFGRKVSRSYADRALGSQAGRYRVKIKKSPTRVSKKGKTYKVFGNDYPYPAGKVVKQYASDRAGRRTKLGRGYGHGRAKMPAAMYKRYPDAVRPGRKAASGRKARGGMRGGLRDYQMALQMLKDQGLSHKDAQKMLATSKKKGMSPMQAAGKFAGSLQAANNPGVFGGLALTNPQYNFMGYAKYAATASVAGVAAYYIHERAVPLVQTEIYDRIPVVGEYLNMAPYLSTGIIAGGVVGAAAGYLGGAAGAYLAVIAGAIVTAGGVLEAQAYTSAASGDTLNVSDEFVGEADLAGLALSNPGVFSGIALDNGALHGIALDNGGMHHLNGIAMDNGGFGDGMAYELADLSMPSYLSGTSANFDEGVSDYAGTSLADALSSGADLSIDEGNAAVIGKSAYVKRFGHPTVRRYAMGAPKGRSHLAGQPGHRWGWLIKLIGFSRFQAIAALPPKKRLSVLKKMRASAIQAYKVEMMSMQTPPAQPEFVSGNAASAANGASTSYGAMLMAGPSYL
jgi:hypothetical protein